MSNDVIQDLQDAMEGLGAGSGKRARPHSGPCEVEGKLPLSTLFVPPWDGAVVQAQMEAAYRADVDPAPNVTAFLEDIVEVVRSNVRGGLLPDIAIHFGPISGDVNIRANATEDGADVEITFSLSHPWKKGGE